MVGRDRRDPAEVVDAGIDEQAGIVDEIRRRLHMHGCREDRPGQPDRIDEIIDRAGRMIAHRGVGLGHEERQLGLNELVHGPRCEAQACEGRACGQGDGEARPVPWTTEFIAAAGHGLPTPMNAI